MELKPGTLVVYEGADYTIEALAGTAVRLRDRGSGDSILVTVRGLIQAQDFEVIDHEPVEAMSDTVLLQRVLDDDQYTQVIDEICHLREAWTGYRSGDANRPSDNEPRPAFDPELTTVKERVEAKSRELGKGVSTLYRRWKRSKNGTDPAGLVDPRRLRATAPFPSVDRRYLDTMSYLIDHNEQTRSSSRTKISFIRQARADLVATLGEDTAATITPSEKTAGRVYDYLRGSSDPSAPARRRRSKVVRGVPSSTKLWASRPGQIVIIDASGYVVRARALGGDPHSYHIVIAIDLYSHAIVAVRLVPRAENRIDLTMLLADIVQPRLPAAWDLAPQDWSYVGIPDHLVAAEDIVEFGRLTGPPFPRVEDVQVDRAKVHVSDAFATALTYLGSGLQIRRRPTDGGMVEAAFRTINSKLGQHFPNFRGQDVGHRGSGIETEPVPWVFDLERWLAQFIAWEFNNHRSVRHPLTQVQMSPNEMLAEGIVRSGFTRVPADPNFYFKLLPVKDLLIHDDGVHLNNLIYWDEILTDFRGAKLGPGPNGAFPIRFDPRDLRVAYFPHPEHDGQHSPLRVKGLWADDMPFTEAALRHCSQLLAERVDRRPTPDEVVRMLNQLLVDIRDRAWAEQDRHLADRTQLHGIQAARDRRNYDAVPPHDESELESDDQPITPYPDWEAGA